jgi:hypothetical protein
MELVFRVAALWLQGLAIILDWPLMVLALSVIVLYHLRSPLSDFLRRTSQVDAYGFRFQAAPPSEQREEAAKADKTSDEVEVAGHIAAIRNNPQQAADIIGRLFRGYRWEKAYNVIYGSQMELLIHLESLGEAGEYYVNLVPFFARFQARGGSADAQMADYLMFLVRMEFLEYYEGPSGQRARLTPAGADFLSYLRAEYGNTFWQRRPY